MRFDYIGKSPIACCLAVFDCLKGISRTLQLTMMRSYIFSSLPSASIAKMHMPSAVLTFPGGGTVRYSVLSWAAIKHNLATAM